MGALVFSNNRDRLVEHDALMELFNAMLETASNAAPALPSDLGHVLTDNRHGRVVKVQASTSAGTAERDMAAQMPADVAGPAKRVTLGADKAYDTQVFVKTCREINVSPPVAQNISRNGGSAIDGCLQRHAVADFGAMAPAVHSRRGREAEATLSRRSKDHEMGSLQSFCQHRRAV